MRIAFISDIHGNIPALDLVLADIEQKGADQIICLGDVASLGPQPKEVVGRLQELKISCIMGNHDNYLLNPHLTEEHIPWLRTNELWCRTKLSESDLDFLSSFQPTLKLHLDPKTSILCYHGSPRSNEEFLYPTISSKDLSQIFSGYNEEILIGGHTHVQLTRQHKGQLLVNPGSVGMPFEFPIIGGNMHALRWAEYAMIESTKTGFSVQLYRLPYDFDFLERISHSSGMPDVELWLSSWAL